jgi:hypothetical protein
MSTAIPLPKIACPHCQGTMKSPGLPAGSKVNCPKCGKPFVLGGAPQPPPGPPPQRVAPAKSAAPRAVAAPPPTVFPPAPPKPPSSVPRPLPSRQPLGHLGPMDAVPADALSAAMATQPAHRPPREDKLVDPSIHTPSKPHPKPQATGITVACKLCGTRVHVPLEKAGQTLQCPDCHTVNVIKAPAPPAKKPAGPTLDDVLDIGMSEVVERPKYKPLVVPRGDDAILNDLDGADHPPGWAPPQAGAPRPRGRESIAATPRLEEATPQLNQGPVAQPPAAAAANTLAFDPPAHEVDPEITLEAPVERLEIKP